MFDWFWNMLSALGFGSKEARILILGLDNAGKTTLIYRLKSGKINSFIPTQRANIEEFEYGGVSFKAFDLGGHAAVRKLWTDYMTDVDAVVFVVDSNDAARHDEARDELHKVAGQQGVESVPIMVLCNKTDLPTAKGIGEMEEVLGLRELLQRRRAGSSGAALTQLFPCSLVKGEGLEDAMRWVGDAV